jgi:hypothetical protein
MNDQTEAPRLREGDCLAEIFRDLEHEATCLWFQPLQYQMAWIESAVDLLAAVPSTEQRVAWAWQLMRRAAPGHLARGYASCLLELARIKRGGGQD